MRIVKFERLTVFVRLFLVILLSVNAIDTFAKPISAEQARLNAVDFLLSEDGRKFAKANMALTLAQSVSVGQEVKHDASPAVYAFNIGDGRGFVLMAGDDVAQPVLGFSETGKFDPDNMPEALKELVGEYAREIEWARSNGLEADAGSQLQAPHNANAAYPTTVSAMVGCKWSQTIPYSNSCIFNSTRCYTGCLATSLAQILYYWAKQGNSSGTYACGSAAIAGYTTKSKKYTVGSLSAISSFDWANATATKPTTTTTKAAVAKIMRYVAQALTTDFSPVASSASFTNVPSALAYTFGYNLGSKYVKASDMTFEQWKTLLYNEIVAKRPVLMMATGSGGSHSFVVDGFSSSSSKFHFNWGWGGDYDGWFLLSTLKVTLNNGTVYNYQSGQLAIININPFEKSAYAKLSTDKTTLSFYYDTSAFTRAGTTYPLNSATTSPKWKATSTVKKVVFSSSFASARPVSTSYWFYNMPKLTTITNLKYLNTSSTTNMSYMFYGCTGLTSIDLSAMSTAKVTNMSYMFYKCNSLASLDLSKFNLSNVTTTKYMMYYCNSVKALSIPATMTKADAVSFYGVGSASSPCVVTAPSGFAFGVTTTGLSFAWKKGYFFLSGNKLPYAVLSSAKLSFYYDATPWSKTGTHYALNTGTNLPAWYSQRANITSVVFNSTFASARPTTAYKWFYGCSKLTSVTGYSYLNMSKVTSTAYMFYGCSSLASLTMPSTMPLVGNYAFYKCTALKSFVVPASVKSIGTYAFYGCTALTTTTLPASVATIGNYAFYGCSALTSVKVKFSTPPTIIANTFTNRKNAYLYVPSGATTAFSSATYWKDFKYIKALSTQASAPAEEDEEGVQTDEIKIIPEVAGSDVKATIYSIDGRLVRQNSTTEGLPAGLYIIDGKKVLIR